MFLVAVESNAGGVDDVAARGKGDREQSELAVDIGDGVGEGVVIFAEIDGPDRDSSTGKRLSPGSIHCALYGDRRTRGRTRRLSASQYRAKQKKDETKESEAGHFES